MANMAKRLRKGTLNLSLVTTEQVAFALRTQSLNFWLHVILWATILLIGSIVLTIGILNLSEAYKIYGQNIVALALLVNAWWFLFHWPLIKEMEMDVRGALNLHDWFIEPMKDFGMVPDAFVKADKRELEAYARELFIRKAMMVLEKEIERNAAEEGEYQSGRFDTEIGALRADMKETARKLEILGFPMGKWDPYFDAAKERLMKVNPGAKYVDIRV